MDKNIEFRISENVDEMISRGFMSAPVLMVDGEAMNFTDAIKWVNNKEG